MDGRRARAMGVSVALHAAVLASLLLIRLHAGEGPARVSIINGELLFDAGTASVSTDSDTQEDGTAAARAKPDPESPQPTPTNEPAADAVVAAANEPEPAPAEPLAQQPPPATAAAAEPTEPTQANANAPAETVAAEEPPTPSAAQEELSPPADAASEAPLAGANELAAATDTAAQADEERSPSASTPPADAPTAAEARGERMPSRQQQMIAKRFASWNGRFTPGEGTPSVDWKQNGQAYTAVFRAPSAADPMGLEHIVVDVSTQQGGKRMSTQLTMTRLAFSNFAQFVDKWDPRVQIHDDVIDGRFHSNTQINVLSTGNVTPVFRGKVTLASRDIATETIGLIGVQMPINRRKVFPEGIETGVRRILLPSRFLPLLNEAANGDAAQRFERDARITFYEDGTYGWSYVKDGAPEQRRAILEPAHYLIGLDGATLRIRGTVNGKVLVYSQRDIVIEDDLVYADGRDAAAADDYLGLVAESDVEIAEPAVTGGGDLEVQASIYARRRFAVLEYLSRRSGTLSIFGSVTAGSITATEPRFATKIEFDRRLANVRPPSFPLTDRYELESWNGQWVEEPASDASLAAEKGEEEQAAN